MSGEIEIRNSEAADLTAVAGCHRKAFPKSLASRQGMAFVRKMLEWYLVADRGVLFHVENSEGKISVYCGGIITLHPGMPGYARVYRILPATTLAIVP